jgi:hypothetical protein
MHVLCMCVCIYTCMYIGMYVCMNGCVYVRRRPAAARFLGLRVRNPLRAWIIASCFSCVLCR